MANIYVTNIPGNAVFKISLQTNKLTEKFNVPLPGGIALSPGGRNLFVTSQEKNNVWVFNTQTQRLIRKIPVGKTPRGIALTPGGNSIWVANADNNTVSVISTLTNKVTQTLDTGKSPDQVAISPDGRFAFISNGLSNTVSVFQTISKKPVATIKVGNEPGHITFTPNGLHAYVANFGSDNISVINVAKHTEISRIPVGFVGSHKPYGLAVGQTGKRLYVSEFLDSLLAIAIPENKIVRRLVFSGQTTGPKAPLGIAIRQNRLYMVASANDQIEIRDLPSLKVITTIDVPATPESEQGLQDIIVG